MKNQLNNRKSRFCLNNQKKKYERNFLKLRDWIEETWEFLEYENFIRPILIIVIIIVISSFSLSVLEPNLSLIDSFWWAIVTLTTVGYGDVTPQTLPGRVIAFFDMFVGIGVLALITATVASILVEKKITQDLGMHTYNFEQHIILCEWNYRSEIIIKELRLERETKKTPIILIADIDRKPIKDKNLFFVKGEVCDETLHQANLPKAKTVIILGDDNLDYKQRDAKVILSTLTVESINQNIYTIVELINEKNIATCKRARADEIIVTSKLSSNLISSAAINHGISKVISDIVTYEYGSQLFKKAVPESEVGNLFIDIFMKMKKDSQSTIIAIQKGNEGEIISNPSPEYQLGADDYLIFIASCDECHSSNSKIE